MQVGEAHLTAFPASSWVLPGSTDLVIVIVCHGELLYTDRDRDTYAPAGSVHLVGSRCRIRLADAGDLQIRYVGVRTGDLPHQILGTAGGLEGARPVGALGSILSIVLDDVFARADAGTLSPALRAIPDLAVACINECIRVQNASGAPASLNTRILDYVKEHLFENSMTPNTIASALGVSVRLVHRAFNTDGRTLSRYIQQQRLTAVALILDSEADLLPFGAVANRTGFTSRDVLSRAFKARFGVTMQEYAATSHQRIAKVTYLNLRSKT